MKEHEKELTQKQMENVNGGGSSVPLVNKRTRKRLTGTPHCRACGNEAISFGALYRCQTAGCPECGKNKTVTQVDWK